MIWQLLLQISLVFVRQQQYLPAGVLSLTWQMVLIIAPLSLSILKEMEIGADYWF